MEEPRRRGVCDPGMGELVQPSEDLGTDRQYPACRGRSPILCRAGTASLGRVTQTTQPPANPGRFSLEGTKCRRHSSEHYGLDGL